MTELLRLAAFTQDAAGGNPAGVWIGDTLPRPDEMLAIAGRVGDSETAFLAPDGSGRERAYRVRYFSVAAEVPFCGHATIAGGVALAERGGPGRYVFETNDGPVTVESAPGPDGAIRATLTTVPASAREADPELLRAALAALRWRPEELDSALPPAIGYAGAHHLILAAGSDERLRNLDYDFDRLGTAMLTAELTTVQLILRERRDHFRARDPFPVGNVVEDPATGAAAAALGAYLRWRRELRPPARFTISQGTEMGRPSWIEVEVPDESGGIRVTGTAVGMELPPAA